MKKRRSKEDLVNLSARHDVLAAIDSDGCVFDSMTVKQRVFREGLIEFWELGAVAEDVHRICEWVGLFSPWRGLNRFQLILKFFQSLEKYLPAIGKRESLRPNCFPTESLRRFIESGVPLSMNELSGYTDEPGLMRVLEWSREMSRRISQLPPSPVFDKVFQCLEKLHDAADMIVVSQTTEDALVREWAHAGLMPFADVIAGAELGSKAESLQTAMKARYVPGKTVMVGDAPGDLGAARVAGALFFPIIPGSENASWVELREQGLPRLLDDSFAGDYQKDLVRRFDKVLSTKPSF